MAADYPTKKLPEQKIPVTEGHLGKPVDSKLEGRQEPTETIRKNSQKN